MAYNGPDGYASDGGYSRRRGDLDDVYDPQQYGMRSFASRDGYAAEDDTYRYRQDDYDTRSRSYQTYEQVDYGAPPPPPQQLVVGGPQGGAVYAERTTRRTRDYSPDEYERDRYAVGSAVSRSHVRERDVEVERGGQKREKEWDRDVEVERGRHRREKEWDRDVEVERGRHRREKERDRSRSRSRSSSRDSNSAAKKWGATLAGAVIGGYGGRAVKKDNWFATAAGAVVGGLVAREAEKQYYDHRKWRDRERQMREERPQSR